MVKKTEKFSASTAQPRDSQDQWSKSSSPSGHMSSAGPIHRPDPEDGVSPWPECGMQCHFIWPAGLEFDAAVLRAATAATCLTIKFPAQWEGQQAK